MRSLVFIPSCSIEQKVQNMTYVIYVYSVRFLMCNSSIAMYCNVYSNGGASLSVCTGRHDT